MIWCSEEIQIQLRKGKYNYGMMTMIIAMMINLLNSIKGIKNAKLKNRQ